MADTARRGTKPNGVSVTSVLKRSAVVVLGILYLLQVVAEESWKPAVFITAYTAHAGVYVRQFGAEATVVADLVWEISKYINPHALIEPLGTLAWSIIMIFWVPSKFFLGYAEGLKIKGYSFLVLVGSAIAVFLTTILVEMVLSKYNPNRKPSALLKATAGVCQSVFSFLGEVFAAVSSFYYYIVTYLKMEEFWIAAYNIGFQTGEIVMSWTKFFVGYTKSLGSYFRNNTEDFRPIVVLGSATIVGAIVSYLFF